MTLINNPKNVFKTLIYFTATLLVLNLLVIFIRLYVGYDHLKGLIPFLDFNSEKNLPTFFSTLLLFSVSYLLVRIALIHRKKKESYKQWLGLSFIFLFLSIDEIASLHEQLSIPMREMFNASGLFYFAWVIPYSIALLTIGFTYLKFLQNLPKDTLKMFLISGAIFVSGALGLEFIGGWYLEMHGKNNLIYSLLYTCEESLEMLGVIIFIYSLLRYIEDTIKKVDI